MSDDEYQRQAATYRRKADELRNYADSLGETNPSDLYNWVIGAGANSGEAARYTGRIRKQLEDLQAQLLRTSETLESLYYNTNLMLDLAREARSHARGR